jgi:hypothetical protein
MNILYAMQNEVHNYGEETQTWMQELDFKV